MSGFPKGHILDIDLSSGTVSSQELPPEIYRLYPGSAGPVPGIAGWTHEKGHPTEATLKRLSLGWLIK